MEEKKKRESITERERRESRLKREAFERKLNICLFEGRRLQLIAKRVNVSSSVGGKGGGIYKVMDTKTWKKWKNKQFCIYFIRATARQVHTCNFSFAF